MKSLKNLSLIILLSFILYGCPEENPTQTDDPIAIDEAVIEQKSEVIGKSGGNISLSDGTEIIIPSNGVISDTKVVLSKIENDSYFPGSNRVSIDIQSDNPINGVGLKIKAKQGLTKNQIGLFRYNPEESTTQLNIEGDAPSFDYDSQTGIISSSVNVAKSKIDKEQLQGSLLFPRWIAEWDENVEGSVQSKIIQMPFYEQPGNSCWATCASMLAKAYTPYSDRQRESEVYDFLKYLQLGKDDGIYCYQFLRTLPKAFHLYSGGAGVEASGYFRLSSLKEKIVKELDENHPVIVSLDYPGVGQHAILVVGYNKKTSGAGKVTYDLVFHNPQGTGNESMYSVKDFDWIFSKKAVTTAVQILYSTNAAHSDRTLLTLGQPLSGLVGEITFKVPYKSSEYNIMFSENISSSLGYEWRALNKQILAVPDTAKDFKIKLPIWNSDRSSSKSANLSLNVYREGKKVYQFSEAINVPSSSSPYWFNKTIPLAEIRQQFDSSEYHFMFELWEGGTYADGFDFKVNIEKGPHPLNGRWIWDLSNTDENCGENYWPESMTVAITTGKSFITMYDEIDEEDVTLEFSYKDNDFVIFYESSSENYKIRVEGTMQGNDRFIAYLEEHTTHYVEDAEGNYTEEPCTTRATITGTRLK